LLALYTVHHLHSHQSHSVSVKREQSLTLSVTAGGEEAARWSEDVRQVPGEAFHLLTGFSTRITLQYCRSREVGEYPMEESHAHCLCRREDICVTPAVHASPCSRRLLAGGWLVLTQSRGREQLLRLSAYWPTSNLPRHL